MASSVDWLANRTTVLIAMQVGCRWCEASASFYRDLVGSNSANRFRVIAIFPEPVAEARTFLSQLAIGIPDVRETGFDKVKVEATPTLILVDGHGNIEHEWEGELSNKQEADVFKDLGIRRVSASQPLPQIASNQSGKEATTDANVITAAQFVQLDHTERILPVIDIRPRSEFRQAHIAGSVNIPVDEIEARASHEIPQGVTVIMFCRFCFPCQQQREAWGISTFCSLGESFLHKNGFSQVKILNDDFSQLAKAGARVVGRNYNPN